MPPISIAAGIDRWSGSCAKPQPARSSLPAAPKIVHAFVPRGTPGVTVKDTWDVLGMRATRSDDTILDGAFVPDRYVARVVPAGAAGLERFVLGIFAWGLLGFGNIYCGMGRRALDLTVE